MDDSRIRFPKLPYHIRTEVEGFLIRLVPTEHDTYTSQVSYRAGTDDLCAVPHPTNSLKVLAAFAQNTPTPLPPTKTKKTSLRGHATTADNMASGSVLTLAKRNLRTAVKKTLSTVSADSLAVQCEASYHLTPFTPLLSPILSHLCIWHPL